MGRSTEVEIRRRSLPLPKLVLSPRTGRDLEKRCAVREACLARRGRTIESPLSERHFGPRHVAKTADTRLSLSGWSAPAETRATQQPKPQRPEPPRPITSETATIARRNSTCDFPKTHHSSEPERLLGHLRLDSPAKVGRFACGATLCRVSTACPECLPPSTEPVSSVAAACWRSHPCGACQAGT